jgi:formate dehydrogenase alpha subunit
VEVDWDTALDIVARKLAETRDTYGPDSVGILTSAKCTNEENYLMNKLARQVIGTNNIDHCARLCHSSTVAGLAMAYGSGAMSNSMRDVAEKEAAIFIIGSTTTEQHPVFGAMLRQAVLKRGAKLIVADPRRIDITEFATLHLQQRPGTDIALLNGLMHIIVQNGWEDKTFIAERTENYETFVENLRDYTPERVAAITGVPVEQLYQAAEIMGKYRPMAVIWAMGITQHIVGVQNVLTLANLQMLLGNMGIPGGGVNPLRGQNNVQGACDMGGLPVFYPGYQRVDVEDIKRKFERLWNAKLPSEPGLTVVEMGHAALEGKLKALYIMGENPILTDPDLHHMEEALKKLDLVVVQDIFFTDTCNFAHVVLPSCAFSEKDGTFTNTERRVQRVRKALPAKGEAKDDWKIIAELSERLGYAMPYKNAEEIFEEIRKATPQYAGITYRRIDRVGIQWPCPTEDHPGTPILHVGKIARGKGLLVPVEYKPPKEQADTEYPFILVTGRNYYQYHTGTMSRKCKVLNYNAPEPVLEINPLDAHSLSVSDEDVVRVISRRGSIEVKAKLSERVKRGEVFSTFHFSEARVNLLTGSELDPVAKIPEFKVTAVRIEKVGKGE